MNESVTIIIAEDDMGHATLIQRNLEKAGIRNKFIHFKDGQETIDFLFRSGEGPHRGKGTSFLLLLDIKMPKVGGVEVLKNIKEDSELCKIPVIMLTTTDDPREVEKCHALGCSNYLVKPVEYPLFIETIKQLGLFLMVVEVPKINGSV